MTVLGIRSLACQLLLPTQMHPPQMRQCPHITTKQTLPWFLVNKKWKNEITNNSDRAVCNSSFPDVTTDALFMKEIQVWITDMSMLVNKLTY